MVQVLLPSGVSPVFKQETIFRNVYAFRERNMGTKKIVWNYFADGDPSFQGRECFPCLQVSEK
jgi:hypothetical protein